MAILQDCATVLEALQARTVLLISQNLHVYTYINIRYMRAKMA